MDISTAAAPRSDQINADDLIGGPQLVTITEVRKGSDEQPVEIVTAEFGPKRPYRPGKSMIRVLIAAWGPQASEYTGRRLMLYRDASITFGKDAVGGIRISAMSHIKSRLTLALTVTRGRRAPYTVEPLADGPAAITNEKADEFETRIVEAANIAELEAVAADLKAWDLGTHAERLKAAGRDRRKALTTTEQGADQ
jgi:hypothetical protein